MGAYVKGEAKARWEARRKERADLKDRLETKWKLQGHPKADLLFNLAWEYGHPAGLHEVEMYYDEFSELLR